MNSDELITIGRIVAPHGVRGDLRILPDTDRPSIYKKLKSIRLGGRTYGLLSARPHKNVYIVHLEGVDDRNTAETLVNQIVQVPLSALPERPEGSIYYFELVGMTVVTEEGDNVGTIKEVLKTGANDGGPQLFLCRPGPGGRTALYRLYRHVSYLLMRKIKS